jgi:hypothetical protein
MASVVKIVGTSHGRAKPKSHGRAKPKSRGRAKPKIMKLVFDVCSLSMQN